MPRNHSHHTILLQYGWVTIRNKTWFETSPIRQDSTEKQNYQYFTFRWLVDKKRTNVYKGCDPPPLHKPLPTTTACHYHGSAIDTAKYWSHTARALTQHVAQPEATSSSSPSPSRNLDESVAPVTGVKPGSQLLHEQRWSTCQYKTAPQSAPSSVRLRGTRSKEVVPSSWNVGPNTQNATQRPAANAWSCTATSPHASWVALNAANFNGGKPACALTKNIVH